MKHLKSYEINNAFPTLDDFQNYLIFDWKDGDKDKFAILEFYEIDYKHRYISTKLIYSYDINSNELESHPEEQFVIFFECLSDIVYQSDNVDDCLNKLELLKNTNKYNL